MAGDLYPAQNPQNEAGGSADYWEGVTNAYGGNTAEIAAMREAAQAAVATGAGIMAVANA